MTRYRVADLEVDVARARVRRDGVELPLPRLSFDLLVALIEIAPAVATVDVLLDKVWPGLVVNPETVSQRVKLLRTALGDDPRQPRYLLVVRGRGCRLLPPVEVLPDDDAAPAPSASVSTGAPATDAAKAQLPPAPFADETADGVAAAVGATPAAGEPSPPRVASVAVRAGWVAAIVALLAVGGWTLVRRAAPPAAAPDAAVLAGDAQTAARSSIAVLPFDVGGEAPPAAMLATGIEESVMHQLGRLPELLVIARTSARAAGAAGLDARAIGRQLGARYLLEGSVQRAGGRTRVTATLVDATRGAGIWSAQFDRPSEDVFAIQDEIALNVARALRLRLDRPAQRAVRGTRQFDAWLEYLQARDLLASGAIADLPRAIERLSRAIQLDPGFARAHVELARAELLAAEYDDPATRAASLERASERAGGLVARALELDPADGRAWLQRAYLLSFSDAVAAEADYRRGLALNPSEAEGWEGLASLTARDPARGAESLAHIDAARRLDPLEPRFDVIKAVFLLYRRSDVTGAEALLRGVLARHPGYVPALARLGETLWSSTADSVAGIRYLEQALAEDPGSEWVRRILVQAYAVLGDLPTATALAAATDRIGGDGPRGAAGEGTAAGPDAIRYLPVLVAREDWRGAGELALRAFAEGTVLEVDDDIAVFAVRRHARELDRAGLERAIARLEAWAGVRWDEAGRPVMATPDLGLMSARVGLADVLQLAGDRPRAARLLELVQRDMDQQSRQWQRGELWFSWTRLLAATMSGQGESALEALGSPGEVGYWYHASPYYLHRDPVLLSLRPLPGYRRLVEIERRWLARQRAELQAAREAGQVPPARR